ncbi:glycosyltransferase family 1 protein [Brachybacterium sp. EF45031]|uniref:glycosyltransferase family protein n=1 Tax=Brachybacterium sillae TaxID=2810536 RepID=UPI00217E838C|nr:glycosyltransferase [Brachybacterium sillae]MCS6711630.1 glycosyltransferase family 1 protein [Brachybacterium sillae]
MTLAEAGVPVRVYGRDWSGAWQDRLRTWRWRTPGLPSGRDLGRADAYGVMAASAATLNIHGDQDGFTIRTFETAGVGGVQLVDRTEVSRYYEPGVEVEVFDGADGSDGIVEVTRRLLADPARAARMREAARRRTLAEHTLTHRAAQLTELWPV